MGEYSSCMTVDVAPRTVAVLRYISSTVLECMEGSAHMLPGIVLSSLVMIFSALLHVQGTGCSWDNTWASAIVKFQHCIFRYCCTVQ